MAVGRTIEPEVLVAGEAIKIDELKTRPDENGQRRTWAFDVTLDVNRAYMGLRYEVGRDGTLPADLPHVGDFLTVWARAVDWNGRTELAFDRHVTVEDLDRIAARLGDPVPAGK